MYLSHWTGIGRKDRCTSSQHHSATYGHDGIEHLDDDENEICGLEGLRGTHANEMALLTLVMTD